MFAVAVHNFKLVCCRSQVRASSNIVVNDIYNPPLQLPLNLQVRNPDAPKPQNPKPLSPKPLNP